MNISISEWPIDRELEKKLGIYDSRIVSSVSVGKVMKGLVKAGYVQINTFTQQVDENTQQITMHFKKI